MALDLNSENIEYKDNKVIIKSLPIEGENLSVFVRPGDEVVIDLRDTDLNNLQYQLVGGDIVISFPGEGALTFASLGLMGFSSNPPVFNYGVGKLISVDDILSKIEAVNELPLESINASFMVRVNSVDEENGLMNKDDESSEAPAIVIISQTQINEEVEAKTEDFVAMYNDKAEDEATDIAVEDNQNTSTAASTTIGISDVSDAAQASLSFSMGFYQTNYETNDLSTQVLGGGGSELANVSTSPTAQIQAETIDLSDDYNNVEIYADNSAYFGNNGEYITRIVRITPEQPEGFGVTQIDISGLNSDFEIIGASGTSLTEDNGFSIVETDGVSGVEFLIKYPSGVDYDTFSVTVTVTSEFSNENLDKGAVIETPDLLKLIEVNDFNIDVKETITASDYVYNSQNGEIGYVLNSNLNSNIIYTSQGDSIVHGSSTTDTIYGQAGDDTIDGSSGNDTLSGGAGTNTLDGGDGSDTVSYDFINRFDKTEVLSLAKNYNLSDAELQDLANSEDVGITINLADGIASGKTASDEFYTAITSIGSYSTTDSEGKSTTYSQLMLDFEDTFTSIENIAATNYNDIVYGDDIDNTLSGLSGNDEIYGNDGDDSLYGNDGDDYLEGGKDSGDSSSLTISDLSQPEISFGDLISVYGDYIDGGAGIDTIGFTELTKESGNTSTDGVNVFLDTYGESGDSNGIGIAYSEDSEMGMGVDLIVNVENVLGSNYNDNLVGNESDNTLSGYKGDDYINGAAGDDTLYGDEGDDTLNGGLGDNKIYGGEGKDIVQFSDSGLDRVVVDLSESTGKKYSSSNVLLGTDTLSDIEVVEGTSGNDTLLGNNNNNELYGGKGDDTLNGRGGVNYLDGGTNVDGSIENDWVNFTSQATVNLSAQTATIAGNVSTVVNIENITGSAYGDILTGSSVSNIIHGESGDDTISGNDGSNVLDGGDGIDTLSYSFYSNSVDNKGLTIDMSTGNAIHGTYEDLVSNFENLVGTDYDDVLTGNTNINTISAGAGDDIVYATAGNDTYDGGTGTNTLDYSKSLGSITAKLSTGLVIGSETGTDKISNFSKLIGSTGNDTISGNSNANTLDGSDGDDVIDGVGGVNTLIAGDGVDTLIARSGADTYDGSGDGADTVDYSNLTTAIDIVLNSDGNTTESTYGHILTEVENIIGTTSNDAITGDSVNVNIIDGFDGDDTLKGGMNSADILYGGTGNDTFLASSGGDSIYGGTGTDTLDYSSIIGTAGVSLNLSENTIYNDGFASVNAHVEKIEIIQGSSSNDTLHGSGLAETFYGNAGNDILNGDGGSDTLYGVAGNNTIDGGLGEDTLYAGTGNDKLIGGAGADTLDARDNGGDNTFIGGLGNDKYYGGTGIDTLDYTTSESAITVLNDNTITSTLDGITDTDTLETSFEVLEATNYADTIRLDGNLAGGTIYANGGNDTIYGSISSDTIYGGNADDTIYANGGNNIYYGGSETSGNGSDVLNYSNATSGINVNLSLNEASINGFGGSDKIYNINTIIATDKNDNIFGNNENNTIIAGKGDDILYLSTGSDILDGGTNTNGDVENDWLSLQYMSASVSDLDLLDNDAGDSKVYNIENVIDYDGVRSQTIWGSNSKNMFVMYGGNDTVVGRRGDDTYDMGVGNDHIYASYGNDIIIGGSGFDTLDYYDYGGANQGSTIILQNTDIDLNGTIDDDEKIDVTSITVSDLNTIDGINDFFTITDGRGYSDYIYKEADGTSDIESFDLTNYADLFVGDEGANSVSGRGGADTILGMGGNDTINSGDGEDLVYGGDGNDNINSGNNDDLVYGEDGDDTINGYSGDDTLYGGIGNDSISGGENKDTLYGGIGDDTLNGGLGDDTIYDEDGTDTIDGGDGTDTVIFEDGSQGAVVDLSTETSTDAFGNSQTIIDVENIVGTISNDIIVGEDGVTNILYGKDGADTFTLSTNETGKSDYIYGGDDTTDTSVDDKIILVDTSSGDIDANSDLLIDPDTFSSDYEITVDMTTDNNIEFDGYSTKFYGIEHIDGSSKDDYIRADGKNNTITGGAGNDYVQGLGGADNIDLGDGDDIVEGGTGDDTLVGGAGNDTLVYSSSTTAVEVDLSTSTSTGSDIGIDTISGFENIVASNSSDTLTGDGQANKIYGLGGDDTIDGGSGEDIIDSGEGDDTVIASLDSDTMSGGEGTDTADYSAITEALTVSVAGSDNITISGATTGTDKLDSFEVIKGGTGADTFTVTSVDGIDTLDGGAGSGLNSLILNGNLDLSNVTLLNFNSITIVNEDITINATELSDKNIDIIFTGTGNLIINSDDSSHNFSNISLTGSGTITLDVNDTKDFTSTNLNGIVDVFDVSGDITLLESQATGTIISGSGSATVEVSTATSNTDFTSILTLDTPANETIEFTADSTFSGNFADSNILVDSGVTLTTTSNKLYGKTSVLTADGNIILADADATDIAATNLSAIGGATSGTVTVTNAINIQGSITEAIDALITADTKVVVSDATVELSDTGSVSAKALTDLDATTTGDIIVAAGVTELTGTISEVQAAFDANDAGTITGLNDDENVIVSDTGSVAATAITNLAAETGGNITINSGVTELTGTIAEVQAVYDATNVAIDGDEAVTVSDTGSVTATVLNSLNSETSGLITAASITTVTGTAAAAKLVTDALGTSGNAINLGTIASGDTDVNFTISDAAATDIAATNLSAIGGATSGTVTVTNAINIQGSITEAIDALITADTKVVVSDATVELSDTGSVSAKALTDLDATTTGDIIVAAGVTELTGTISEVQAAFDANDAGTITGLNDDENVIVSDTGSVAATAITNLAAETGGNITINSGVTELTGTIAEVQAVYDATNVAIDGDEAVTVSDTGSVTATVLNSLNSETSGLITAASITTVTGTAAAAKLVTDALGTSGNAINLGTIASGDTDVNFTISDAAATDIAATNLSAIGGATSGTVTVTNAINIQGSITEAIDALITADTKVVVSDATVELSDTGSVSAKALTDLDATTTGDIIVAAGVTELTGTISEVQAAFDANDAGTITGLNDDENVIVSDTGSVAATAITNLAAETGGNITINSGVTELTGTIAEVQAVYDATNVAIDGDEAVTVSDTGSVTATVLNSLNSETSGLITAASITTVTGTAAAAKLVTDALGTSGNAINLGTIASGDTDVNFTISDAAATDIAATNLSAIGGATSGTVTVTNAINIQGSITEAIDALITADTKVVVSDATVELSDTGSVSAKALTDLDATTTGDIIVAAGVTELTGTISEVQAAFDANDAGTITGLNDDENVIVSDTGSVAATAITNLAAETGGNITINSGVTELTGTIAEVQAVYDATNVAIDGDEAVTVSDTGSVTATVLNSLNSETSGLITAASITTVTGTAAAAKLVTDALGTSGNAINLGTIASGDTDVNFTISDAAATDIAATNLSAIGGATSGTVTVTNAINIQGSITEAIDALITADTKVVVSDATVELSDTGSVSAKALTDLDATTTGDIIVAAGVTELTGTISEVQAAFDANDAGTITGLNDDENVIVSDTGSVAATAITNLAAETGGNITLDGNGSLEINVSLNETLNLSGVTNNLTENLTITDSIGDETIYGTSQNDIINLSSGNDTVYAGSGSDTIYSTEEITALDTIDGGGDSDTLDFTNVSTISSSAFTNVIGIETVSFSDDNASGDDITIDDNSLASTSIELGEGDDTFTVDFSNIDSLSGSAIYGGEGSDTLSISGVNGTGNSLTGNFEDFEILNLSGSGDITINSSDSLSLNYEGNNTFYYSTDGGTEWISNPLTVTAGNDYILSTDQAFGADDLILHVV